MRLKALFLLNLIVWAGLILGPALAGNSTPTPAATLTTDQELLQRMSAAETAIAILQQAPVATQQPPTSTPSPSATASFTRTPQGIPPSPTDETGDSISPTPTFAPGTNTPTPSRTPAPTGTPAGETPVPTANPDYWNDCVPTGDFEAYPGYSIPRRMNAVIGNNTYPNPVTDARDELVCIKSQFTDSAGITWIQVSSPRPEWFAVSRLVNGITEYNGVLHEWGSTLYPFTTEGNRIYLNGDPWKFTGVNFRELIGYDFKIMPYAGPGDVVTQLDGARALGMRVVRFYVSHKSLTVEQAIPRVRNILNMLEVRGMYGILVLSDGAFSGFNVADNSSNRRVLGIDRYTHEFYAGGFRQNYLPYVDALTKAIGAHPAIFSWEPINEATTIQIPPSKAQMDAFLNFYAETAAVIRRNSPGKLISTGLESCYQLFVIHAYDGDRYCERLYAITDLGTLHTYQENTGQVLGSSWMHVLRELQIPNQPLIVEETNTVWSNESSDWLAALVKAAFNRLSGILHWNMSFPYAKDIGVGDGAWNAPAGTAQARRWFNLVGFYRALADQLQLQY